MKLSKVKSSKREVVDGAFESVVIRSWLTAGSRNEKACHKCV